VVSRTLCPGEEVMYLCTFSGGSLRWQWTPVGKQQAVPKTRSCATYGIETGRLPSIMCYCVGLAHKIRELGVTRAQNLLRLCGKV